MEFHLQRFIEAQDEGNAYAHAIKELEAGKKKSHWMWYVFPQIKGLGHSQMAKKYAISCLYEAYAYVNNSELRTRLHDATHTLNECCYGRDIEDVLGQVDAMKFRSCMTLFDIVEPDSEFDRALENFFNGKRDQLTLNMVKHDLAKFKARPFQDLRAKFPERAYFDSGCHEANKLSSAGRIATFADLKQRGYKVVDLCRNYLIGHFDLYDHYRTSNLEHTLSAMGHDIIIIAVNCLLAKGLDVKAKECVAIFPFEYFEMSPDTDWETCALRIDHILSSMQANHHLSKLLADLTSSHTTLLI